MDPVLNPYSPGAGNPPPELAGRDELREKLRIALLRTKLGKPEKSAILVGLRGVGKTVLLDQVKRDAERNGIHTIRIEAPEGRSLPSVLAPHLRTSLLSLSKIEKARNIALRALRGLAGFVKGLKLKYQDIELIYDYDPEPGLADSGDLEHDLGMLLEEAGAAAKYAESALVIFIDELQYVREPELASLIAALLRCTQKQLPVAAVGAGLPQLRGKTGKAKSYSERLFEYPEIGPLTQEAAKDAIEKPALKHGVEFEPDAIDLIIGRTKGYPYFLQEWGKHAWNYARSSPITLRDVEQASELAVAALDASFFRVRFDRLTPLEKKYLRAMAELGPGPHRSGDIAEVIGRAVSSLGPTRGSLISKGMIWSPNHGDTAFTVPLFDEFMKRIMPGSSWKEM
ncbi:MAG: ATP-binding protein [Bdellovibrionaceae bacterium]|nr:ATP-binding protein [Pseudobdellovibrionaceae bacterium]